MATSFTKSGAKQETAVKLDKAVFGAAGNDQLVSQAYNTYLANGRVAGATTLTRGDVRGGGKKPHKQKGTGRSRAGSSRIPHWRGGGIAFGPTGDQNYTVSLSVKAKRVALREALSLKAKADVIAVIESFDAGEGKVKPTVALIEKLKFEGRILLVVADRTPLLDRATRNITDLQVVTASYLNVFIVMNADHILFTKDALEAVNLHLGEDK